MAGQVQGNDTPGVLALPKSFTTIRDILDGKVKEGGLVTVFGLVKDFRQPVATKTGEWKCTVRLHDLSSAENSGGVELSIFRKDPKTLPVFAKADVVLVRKAKVQHWQGEPSLLTTWTTLVQAYAASRLPPPPASGQLAWRGDPRDPNNGPPSLEEHNYASFLYAAFRRDHEEVLPSDQEYQVMTMQSVNVRLKFSELKDVRDGQFYDLLVQLVKKPFADGDRVTIWVSDFTEHPSFYNFEWKGPVTAVSKKRGDEFGYISKHFAASPANDWPGPYGRRSLQITCYEPHASAAKDLAWGTWLRLRNVQVKHGHNAQNLEGFLRQDMAARSGKIQLEVVRAALDPGDDPETLDPRLKDALRRKKAYEKSKKAQMREIQSTATGLKRGVLGDGAASVSRQRPSKKRRQLRRAQQPEETKTEIDMDTLVEMNGNVSCENQDKPITPLLDILAPVVYELSTGGQSRCELPFVCAKYRSVVRVIDFYPESLEDFACSRRISEFDCLSDNGMESSDADSVSSTDETTISSQSPSARVWEWRFALRLEDAGRQVGKAPRESLWAVVTNSDAQLLTGLDACDLRRCQHVLGDLRQRLFLLWGNLEEKKVAMAKAATERQAAKRRGAPGGPPLDSSEDETEKRGGNQDAEKVSNLPFACCLRQYGVQVPEENPEEANAEPGKRWRRTFGLFGTKIASYK